eukprot:m.251942 g.251942  ORF g.251942 m.251942 type:complete len:55 (+) comp15464_c0_seq1:692-856(+)
MLTFALIDLFSAQTQVTASRSRTTNSKNTSHIASAHAAASQYAQPCCDAHFGCM